VRVQIHASATLPPVPTGKESGWAPAPVWRSLRGDENKNLAPIGDTIPAVQPVAYLLYQLLNLGECNTQ
jgi:hypothetical protein